MIGGGISGLCSAYYLVKEGYEVKVIDKGDITTGASFINAGYIVPSHFISLAAPGMFSKGLKWMFSSDSPFYVKPRLDLDFFRWVCNFKKSATAAKVEKAIPVIKNINLKSRELYEEMLSAVDFDFHYERKGLLLAYCTSKSEKEELEVAERAVKEGLEATLLSKDELRNIQPGFSDKVKGAIHYKCDSHTTPNHFMLNLKQWLRQQGVVFELNQEVQNFVTVSGEIKAVETTDNRYEADEFILTAGTWTSRLANSIGLNIPIQGGKGYSIDLFRPNEITLPAILVEAKVAVTPMKDFTRFAGTMEFSGNNTFIKRNRIEAIANSVQKYYSNLELLPKEKASAISGLRPVSPDGLPFLGRTSKYKNLIVASGHAMMGWSLGPLTGQIVSELVANKPTSVEIESFKVERFA